MKYQVVEDTFIIKCGVLNTKGEDTSVVVCTQDTWKDAIKAAENYRALKCIVGIVNGDSIHIREVNDE